MAVRTRAWAVATVLLGACALTAACGFAVPSVTMTLRAAGTSGATASTVRLALPTYPGAGRVLAGGTPATAPPDAPRPGAGTLAASVSLVAPAAESLVAAWDRNAFTQAGFLPTRSPSPSRAGWWRFTRGTDLTVSIYLDPVNGGQTRVTYFAVEAEPPARRG